MLGPEVSMGLGSIVLLLAGCEEEARVRPDPNWPCACAMPPQPPHVEDRVYQGPGQTVDVLIVVQETPEMDGARRVFASQFSRLVDDLLALDAHIGVVSSDLDDADTAGILTSALGHRWIDATTSQPEEVLRQMLLLGKARSPLSQPMGAVHEALEARGERANAGFFREDAALAVMVVSDGTDLTSPEQITEEAFADWLVSVETESAPTYSCVLAGSGTACAAISEQLGGQVEDVTERSTYDRLFGRASGLSMRFPLSAWPVPETLQVAARDPSGAQLSFEEGEDWLYDPQANSVVFLRFLPAPEMWVELSYEPVDPLFSDG